MVGRILSLVRRCYATSYYRDVVLSSVSKNKIDHVALAYEAVALGHPEVIDDIEEIHPGTYRAVYNKAIQKEDLNVSTELQYLVRNDSK